MTKLIVIGLMGMVLTGCSKPSDPPKTVEPANPPTARDINHNYIASHNCDQIGYTPDFWGFRNGNSMIVFGDDVYGCSDGSFIYLQRTQRESE